MTASDESPWAGDRCDTGDPAGSIPAFDGHDHGHQPLRPAGFLRSDPHPDRCGRGRTWWERWGYRA